MTSGLEGKLDSFGLLLLLDLLSGAVQVYNIGR